MRVDLLKSFDRVSTAPKAVALWDAAPGSLEFVRQSENFVYRFSDPAGTEKYLRITPIERRTVYQLTSEIDYVLYLHDHGIKLAPPVKSSAGNWIETIETPEGIYNLTVWQAIYGDTVQWGLDKDNRRYLFQRGKALGKIHRLSLLFKPGKARRHEWYEDSLFTDPEKFLDESDIVQKNEYNTLIKWLVNRPRTPQNYGMTHGDFGSGNTRHANGEVVCFDFDDCSFHWYIYDLAVAIRAGRKLSYKYRKQYLQVLIDGYTTEMSMNGDSVVEVAMFCRVASLYRYIAVLRKCRRTEFDEPMRRLFDERLGVLANPPQWY